MIPYSTQEISKEDEEEVIKVLNSDLITQGPKNVEFENLIKEKTNSQYAFSTNSASSALHIACLALDLGPGDIVWTSPISFVASANCAINCGAQVEFVDVNPLTYNMSVDDLEEKLISARKKNKIPKIIIPVHLAGQSCEMEQIQRLSIEYGFKIIEDASHAVGAKYLNFNVGSCEFSDITVFSFHPVKIITTGEGGMALTNNDNLANRIGMLINNGITKKQVNFKNSPDGEWYYEQQEMGFNYRLNDIQAALGCSQISRLDKNIEIRDRIAKKYDSDLKNLPVKTPFCRSDCITSHHLYIIRILENAAMSHADVFKSLRNNGIGVNLHYIPIYKHPFFQKLGFENFKLPNAEDYYKSAISIPIFPKLNDEQQSFVVEEIKKCVL